MGIISKFRRDFSYDEKSEILNNLYENFIELTDIGCMLVFAEYKKKDSPTLFYIDENKDVVISLDWSISNFEIRNNIYHGKSISEVKESLEFIILNINDMERRFNNRNENVIISRDMAKVYMDIDDQVIDLPIWSNETNRVSKYYKSYGKKFFGGETYLEVNDKDLLRNYIISYKIIKKNYINRFSR